MAARIKTSGDFVTPQNKTKAFKNLVSFFILPKPFFERGKGSEAVAGTLIVEWVQAILPWRFMITVVESMAKNIPKHSSKNAITSFILDGAIIWSDFFRAVFDTVEELGHAGTLSAAMVSSIVFLIVFKSLVFKEL
ncbi:MAG: hypothetical protein EBS31_04930 [Burkholderiaceae bacterium]|nr:hypothetical protein [Burkholderiaceae bacterium]